jgi:hypothetical protein
MAAARDRIGGAYRIAAVLLGPMSVCSFLSSMPLLPRQHCMHMWGSCVAVILALAQSKRELAKSIVNICAAF